MDAAAAALMSDPERNPLFRRRWAETGEVVVPRPAPRPDLDDALDGVALLAAWRRERTAEGGRAR